MTIKQIKIYKSPVKLNEPFVISLGSFEYARNIALIIRTSDGIEGCGECSPFEPINGESIDTCFIVGNYIAKALLGKDPLKIEECSLIMNKIIYGNTSIKSAFDIALHDIASRAENIPLYSFIGGKNDKQIITDYTVSIGSPQKMADDAIEIKERGFGIIKVKLGDSGRRDIERIRSMRKAVGYDVVMRTDANQGWDKKEAIDTLNELHKFDIQFCEEPIARWNFTELPEVKAKSPVPVMADESCFDHHDAKRLIGLRACDHINIKLGKSSGILNALKIIRLAEKAGITIQTGGFLETRLGFTAAAHLALSSSCIRFFDLDTPLMQSVDPVVGGIRYGNNGLITLTDDPGLGATFDRLYLKNLEKAVIS